MTDDNAQYSKDIRDKLAQIGILWKTEQNLSRYHKLAEQSLVAVNHIVSAYALEDTPKALPQATIRSWLTFLMQTAVETILFPDDMPRNVTTWEDMATIWDDYFAHCRQLLLDGVHGIPKSQAWAMRSAIRAAWNIEFSVVGERTIIGPVVANSVHRASILSAENLWTENSLYKQKAGDDPQSRESLWDSFMARWPGEETRRQTDHAKASLASELNELRNRLGFMPKPPVAATQAPNEPKSRADKRAEWLARAMLMVRDHPDWSDAEIARHVGKNAGTLSRSSEYQMAANLARGSKTDRPKGYVKIDPISGAADVEGVAPPSAPLDEHSDRGKPIPGSRHFREYCAVCDEPIKVARSKIGTKPECDQCAI